MKYTYILICLLRFFVGSAQQDVTTVYLIRHAEKANNSADSELSSDGEARALRWKDYFLDKSVSVIFSTPYKRTLATAKPLANAVRKDIIMYKPSEMNLADIVRQHSGKNILIVGHSNTIPAYINNLLRDNKYEDISENEYSNLYTIVIKGDVITHDLQKL